MTSSEPVVLVEVVNGVATITLNRPQHRNAMSKQLNKELAEAIRSCENDESVRCSILTGAGKAFCAGVDLKEFSSGTGIDPRARSSKITSADNFNYRGISTGRTKPLIAAVNGPSVTGGLELALNCDFIIGSENASFADTHARVGVMPGMGLTVELPQRIGVARAKQMSITGAFVFARQAYEWGLVNEVVPAEQLLPRARELALAIASSDPAAIKHMIATYNATTGGTPHQGWLEEQVRKRSFTESDGKDVGAKYDGIRKRGADQQPQRAKL